MRRILNWLVIITLLWSAYWGVAAWALREGLSEWFSERAREGWIAEHDGFVTSGYPLNHVTQVTTPILADPGTGTAWSADWISFENAAVSPTQQVLRFPETPQRFSYFDESFELQANDMRAGLGLAPGSALELEHLSLLADAWVLRAGQQALLSAQSFLLRMEQAEPPATYDLRGSFPSLSIQGNIQRLIDTADGLPQEFETLEFYATTQFDTAWDRRALELRRPQPRHIQLHTAHAQWGPMQLRATGALTMDESGRPEGNITVQAQEWRRMLTLAEESGLLPVSLRNNVERVLTLLAGRSGHPDRLELRLNFARGQVMLGPLPLGPARRIVLR